MAPLLAAPRPLACAFQQGFRKGECPDYGACLLEAGRNKWEGFTCAGCPRSGSGWLLDVRQARQLAEEGKRGAPATTHGGCPYCPADFPQEELCPCHWEVRQPMAAADSAEAPC